MKIGIITSFASRNPAGLERFFIDLMKSMDNALERDECLVYCGSDSDLDVVFSGSGIKNVRVVKVRGGMLWKHIGLLFAERSDVYLFNGPLVSFFFRPKRYTVLIYDFAYKHIPADSIRKKVKTAVLDLFSRLAFQRAKKIITISEATKKELINLFRVNEKKIDVVLCGFTRICDLTEKHIANIPKRYFLFVGTFKERKNVLNIVKAFALFVKEAPGDHSLVLVGKHDKNSQYAKSIFEYIEKEKIGDKVMLIGHIDDNELAFLYRHATALVFPSLLEGFGLPILEAMSCGTPVVTSNTSSLPEVAGNAAILVDPLRVEDIAKGMHALEEDERLRKELVMKGYQQIMHFSWEKAAKEILTIMRKS